METPGNSLTTEPTAHQPAQAEVRTYVGRRTTLGTAVEVWSTPVGDLRSMSCEMLPPRLDLWNHSPIGLEWGYLGSGPAQLALAILAILANCTGDDIYAKAMHQGFKMSYVGSLPREGWILFEDNIQAWVKAHTLAAEDRRRFMTAEELDQDQVESSSSACCGAPQKYRSSRESGRYQAFLRCSECGAEQEFI